MDDEALHDLEPSHWEDDQELCEAMALNTSISIRVIFSTKTTVNMDMVQHEIPCQQSQLTLRSKFDDVEQKIEEKFASLDEGWGKAAVKDILLVTWDEKKKGVRLLLTTQPTSGPTLRVGWLCVVIIFMSHAHVHAHQHTTRTYKHKHTHTHVTNDSRDTNYIQHSTFNTAHNRRL